MVNNTWTDGNATGIWSDPLNWSQGHIPAAGEDIIFDNTSVAACSVDVDSAALNSVTVANNYSGTITVNINQTGTKGAFTISGGTGVYNTNGFNEFFTTVTVNAGGTLTGGASAISVAGNWTSNAGTFNYNTSTITFTASGSIAVGGNFLGDVYNITINTGVTLTLSTNICYWVNVVTLNGTATLTCVAVNKPFWTSSGSTQAVPLVLSGSENIANAAFGFAAATATTITIPAGTYGQMFIAGAATTTRQLGGNIVIGGSVTFNYFGTTSFNVYGHVGWVTSLNTQGHNISCTTMTVGASAGGNGSITCGASVITATSVAISLAASYLVMNTSSWSVAGNWTNSTTSASWNTGTSTVTFTANANLAGAYLWNKTGDFYNLIINTGVTITQTVNDCTWKGQLTLNGTAKITGTGRTLGTSIDATNPNPLVVSGSQDITTVNLFFYNNASFNIPAINVKTLDISPYGNFTATLTGALTVTGTFLWYYPFNAGNTTTFNTNGQTVTTTNAACEFGTRQAAATFPGFLLCDNSTFNLSGFVLIPSTTSYINFSTSTWNVAGNWTVASTSALWSAGTSTINFNGTGAQTLGLNNGNSANIQYYNITISNSSAATVTLGANNIRVNGLLNISSATCTVSETVNNPTWTIYGGITKANGSTWTRGTGLMTLAGSQTLTDNGVAHTDLLNVTVNGVGIIVTMTTTKGFNFSGTLHLQAGNFVTGDLVAVTTLVNNGIWGRVGGGVSTVTIGTLQIDAGTVFVSGDAPAAGAGNKKIGISGLYKT